MDKKIKKEENIENIKERINNRKKERKENTKNKETKVKTNKFNIAIVKNIVKKIKNKYTENKKTFIIKFVLIIVLIALLSVLVWTFLDGNKPKSKKIKRQETTGKLASDGLNLDYRYTDNSSEEKLNYYRNAYSNELEVTKTGIKFVKEQLNIDIKKGTTKADVLALISSDHGRIIGEFDEIGMYLVEFKGKKLEDLKGLIEKYKKSDKINNVTLNYVLD